ncbi:hypothetical protein [Paenibacillus ehimensis]|uniref:hypothetical protein n=1 Tax=Paenibacillus ehimensis TaxID=79264 RepID=UPI00047101BD|nr:hypothetical protein [Paenibacillus ehimensis]
MNFDNVIDDLQKMEGLLLKSIKAGSDIRFESVDRKGRKVWLLPKVGRLKSRPFSELERIWEALCKESAIHVDKVLGGSGSSRNQPETLMANLPYVEWCYIQGKKHLVLKPEPTHHYGTLKQLDDMEALELAERLSAPVRSKSGQVIIVSTNVAYAAGEFQKATGIRLETEGDGIYIQEHSDVRVTMVPQNVLEYPLSPGTYLVIQGNSAPEGARPVRINGEPFYAVTGNGLNMLVSLG